MTGKQKVGLLRQLIDWCKDFNKGHFKDTPSFITAFMPLVNQEPDDEWAERVKNAATKWAVNATQITGAVEVNDDPDIALYNMFNCAVWAIVEDEWDKTAAYFSDD